MGGVLPAWAQALPAASSAPRELVVRRPNILYLSHSRFVVQYDSRYPILSHHFTTINGLKLGIEFKHRFRIGGAVYFLSTGVPARRWSMAPQVAGFELGQQVKVLPAGAVGGRGEQPQPQPNQLLSYEAVPSGPLPTIAKSLGVALPVGQA